MALCWSSQSWLPTRCSTLSRPSATSPPLHLSNDQALLIGVTDGGPSLIEDGWTANRPADERGRGGFIVDALTTGAGEINQHDGFVHRWAAVESPNDWQS